MRFITAHRCNVWVTWQSAGLSILVLACSPADLQARVWASLAHHSRFEDRCLSFLFPLSMDYFRRTSTPRQPDGSQWAHDRRTAVRQQPKPPEQSGRVLSVVDKRGKTLGGKEENGGEQTTTFRGRIPRQQRRQGGRWCCGSRARAICGTRRAPAEGPILTITAEQHLSKWPQRRHLGRLVAVRLINAQRERPRLPVQTLLSGYHSRCTRNSADAPRRGWRTASVVASDSIAWSRISVRFRLWPRPAETKGFSRTSAYVCRY